MVVIMRRSSSGRSMTDTFAGVSTRDLRPRVAVVVIGGNAVTGGCAPSAGGFGSGWPLPGCCCGSVVGAWARAAGRESATKDQTMSPASAARVNPDCPGIIRSPNRFNAIESQSHV